MERVIDKREENVINRIATLLIILCYVLLRVLNKDNNKQDELINYVIIYVIILIPLIKNLIRSFIEINQIKKYELTLLYDKALIYRRIVILIMLLNHGLFWYLIVTEHTENIMWVGLIALIFSYNFRNNPIYETEKSIIIDGKIIDYNTVKSITTDELYNIIIVTDNEQYKLGFLLEKTYTRMLKYLNEKWQES